MPDDLDVFPVSRRGTFSPASRSEGCAGWHCCRLLFCDSGRPQLKRPSPTDGTPTLRLDGHHFLASEDPCRVQGRFGKSRICHALAEDLYRKQEQNQGHQNKEEHLRLYEAAWLCIAELFVLSSPYETE